LNRPGTTASPVTIEPVEDGPLVVSGLAECVRESGERVPIDGTAYLCRCGGSADKPFCDGSHNRNGFSTSGSVAAGYGPTREFPGRELSVLDNRSACARAGFCVEFAPKVFSRDRKPWIEPDASPRDHVIRTIRLCPSGALALAIDRRRARFRTGARPEVHVLRNGPYCVIGPAALEGPLQPLDGTRYALCRCGGSRNKPFCDGSHVAIGFRG
jgi:CDGSH-type Zn-finger protein